MPVSEVGPTWKPLIVMYIGLALIRRKALPLPDPSPVTVTPDPAKKVIGLPGVPE